MTETFFVPMAAAGERIDLFLAGQLGQSRAAVQKACKAGLVICGGKPAKANLRLEGGETIAWTEPESERFQLVAEDLPLDIRYEDEDMLIVNKPRGMVVHPSQGHPNGTLVNALLAHTGGFLPQGDDPLRPGIVHRLDRDTSGLLAVAKSERGYKALAAQVLNREMTRIYYALVHGTPAADKGTIRLPLGRHPRQRLLRAVMPEGGREAVTHFTVVERMASYALLRCQLETGRTHQIRVHLAHIGHPVVQDPLYGDNRDHFPIEGQALHAAELIARRPADGSEIHCRAEIPEDMEKCIRIAREKRD